MATEYVSARRKAEQEREREQQAREQPRDTSAEKRDASAEERDASAEERDASAEKRDASSKKHVASAKEQETAAKEAPEQSAMPESELRESDVVLDIPAVKIGEMPVDVDGLRAHVSVFAKVRRLHALEPEAEAFLGKLERTSRGAEAQALLESRLHEVYAILAQTLSGRERKPETTVEETAEPVGEVVGDTVREAATGRQHSRALRVLRPIEKTARKCAASARRAIGTARQAVRARREAKAAEDLT